MPIYMRLINYTDQGIKRIKEAPDRVEKAKQAAKAVGGELKEVYLTVSGYDPVTISQAPSDEVAATVTLTLASQGRIRTTTLRAFTEPEFMKIVSGLPKPQRSKCKLSPALAGLFFERAWREDLRTMNREREIYAVAKILIREHGEHAPIHAAMQADELLDQGDLDGAAVWRRIVRAIEEMLRAEPDEDEIVH